MNMADLDLRHVIMNNNYERKLSGEVAMKKFISVALVAAMTASLAACGSSSESTDTAAETTAAAEEAETEAEAAEEDTEAEADADAEAADESSDAEGGVFVIGGTGPLTGGAALYGEAVNQGAQVAVDEINAAGGINGYQVEWIFEDDEHDAEKALNAYNTLKDQGIQMFVGTVTSGPCLAVVEETADDNMFQLTPSGTTADITANPNVFRMCFSDPAQGTKSAQYIGEHGLATKVGVIYDSSDPYSQGIYEAFDEAAPEYGIEVVAAEAFTADSKTDFKTQIQKMKDAEAELVFLPFYYTEAALVLQQSKELDYAPIFFGCDGMDGILNLENFDTSLAEGLMLLTPFSADATDDLTVNFVTKYEEAYGSTPIQFAADAYDSIYAIKLAAEEAGITPDMSVSDICDAIVPAMQQIQFDGLTGAGITFDENGEPEKEPKAVVIENGAYVSAD